MRERVRGSSFDREAPVVGGAVPIAPEPAPITPLRPEPAAFDSPPRIGDQGSAEVERIADLWPNVRADVKALNRRIEALLSEVDPVAVSGNQITLAVPYPFHRDKLNSDEVSETVAGVLSRLLGREVSLVCILRGEMTAPDASPPHSSVAASPAPEREPTQSEPSPEDERIQARITAAKNIFDAEEVTESDCAAPVGAVPKRLVDCGCRNRGAAGRRAFCDRGGPQRRN